MACTLKRISRIDDVMKKGRDFIKHAKTKGRRVEVLTGKPNDLSLVSGTHTVRRGLNPTGCPVLPCVLWHEGIH